MVIDTAAQFQLLERTLGEGGYGMVRAAIHRKSGESVAVKIISQKRLQSPSSRLLIDNEVRLMRHLNSSWMHQDWPCPIVQLLATDTGPRHYHIFLELCERGDLFDVVGCSPDKYSVGGFTLSRLSERDAVGFLKQLLVAVQFCHAEKVAHRDLKLDNVILKSNGLLKLIDFGFAVECEEDGFGGWLPRKENVGSQAYCAPEVLKHAQFTGYDAFTSDIWSLGVCLFLMLAGFFPFGKKGYSTKWDNTVPTLQACQQSTVDYIFQNAGLPTPFSKTAVDLIDRMLTVDPKNRIHLDEIVRHPWLLGASEGVAPAPAHGMLEREDSMDAMSDCLDEIVHLSSVDTVELEGSEMEAYRSLRGDTGSVQFVDMVEVATRQQGGFVTFT